MDGAFSLASRPSRLTIEVRRGLETLPLIAEVDLAIQKSQPLIFRLQRWIDLREQGYLSGDTRPHVVPIRVAFPNEGRRLECFEPLGDRHNARSRKAYW